MKRWTLAVFAAVFAAGGLGLAPSPALAASPDQCAPTVDMDPLQLLRQVSLDLRGHVPTYEEYEWVRGSDDPAASAGSSSRRCWSPRTTSSRFVSIIRR